MLTVTPRIVLSTYSQRPLRALLATAGRVKRMLVPGLMACVFAGCSVQNLFEEEQRYFDEHIKDSPKLVSAMQNDLHYVRAGDPARPILVFIHGTPGDWTFAARYLVEQRLLARAQVVSIDRPGWGKSQTALSENPRAISFAEQARRIEPLLSHLKNVSSEQPIILVGHSMGASLAPRIVLDYPDLVDGMVLIAGALDPNLGKPRWYNLAASMGVVSWFLGNEMRHANREIMPMHDELAALAERWADIEVPVTVIQGMQDGLVDPGNADYAERVLTNAELEVIRMPEAGHLIPWQHRDLLVDQLLDVVQRVESVAVD